MPAVIDPNVCDRNWASCFPARMCPQDAFSFDTDQNLVTIEDSLCGDCPGPCVNFCDQYAIRYTPDHDEFSVLKSKTLGELSEEEAAEELNRIKEQAKQEASSEDEQSTGAINATSMTFAELVLQSEIPVIVDFWAPWCGPCRQMAPVFEKLAEQYRDNLRFVKVNTDEEPSLAQQYRITALPTVGLFWQGQMVDNFAGALSEPQLQSLAYQFLAAVRTQQASNDAPDGDGPDLVTP